MAGKKEEKLVEDQDKKEQVPVYLRKSMLRQIDDYIISVSPTFKDRSHFFEVLVHEYLNNKKDGEKNDKKNIPCHC